MVEPFREFFSRRGAIDMLLLIVLYKLGDAFAGALSTTFLLRGAGFSATEVGTVNKVLGLAATIIGALAGGSIMTRWGLYRSLMAFGLLQAVSNLGYWLIAVSPKNLYLMGLAVGVENLLGGLGTASFVALLMAMCRQRFSATQFALLSALAAVGLPGRAADAGAGRGGSTGRAFHRHRPHRAARIMAVAAAAQRYRRTGRPNRALRRGDGAKVTACATRASRPQSRY